jgi:hypothetical protein
MVNVPLPRPVVETMAKREHRLHHWLWHQVRNSWFSYPDDVKKQIEDLGWKPPRPAFDTEGRPNVDNDAGEDFLYMHRQMIGDVNMILAGAGDPNYPRIQPWLEPPPPGDPGFPIPPLWTDPTGQGLPFERLQRAKSDVFYEKRMRYWHKTFTNPVFLRGMSLGKLGTLIELTIHNAMHMRWAAAPAGIRPEPGPAEGDTIGTEWDDPRYDYLGDTYSSHVNPIFWLLHGWINDRIEDWKEANGVFAPDQFWKGRWVGKMPGHEMQMPAGPGPHALMEITPHAAAHSDEAEELLHVIARSGVIHKGVATPISYETW